MSKYKRLTYWGKDEETGVKVYCSRYSKEELIDRLAMLEDRLENGLAFDLTDEQFDGASTFIAREGTFGYPMLAIPITEEEVKTLLDNGIEDCLDSCIVLE